MPARVPVSEPQSTGFKISDSEPDTAPVADEDTTVRVPVRQLNQLNDSFGELTIDRNGLDLYLKRLRGLARTLHDRVQILDQVNSKLRTAYDRVTLNGTRSLNESAMRRSGFDALELDRYSDLHFHTSWSGQLGLFNTCRSLQRGRKMLSAPYSTFLYI